MVLAHQNREFTFGCDPEVFLRTKNGEPASAHGLLPGTKEAPHKTEGGAIQVDGMAAEFNTDPVQANDFETFNARIVLQQRIIREMLPDDLAVSVRPVQEFGKEFLDTQPEEAKELGCDPDYNAYTLLPNPRPDADKATFRTGAGHIHVGWGADIPIDNEEHLKICADFVKYMDATVGLFMTVIDTEPRRRELYGKAGAFRPKPYGVEYRTPSNVWIKNRRYRAIVHELTNAAIWLAKGAYTVDTYFEVSQEEIREIIDSGNSTKALRSLQHFKGFLRYASPVFYETDLRDL